MRTIFESPGYRVLLTNTNRVCVIDRCGVGHTQWQAPAVETEAFLDRLAAVREDDIYRDQAAVHAFLTEEMKRS